MGGKIYIESKTIVPGVDYNHAYLVYENERGEEYIIRGGPKNDNPGYGGIL